jgi:methylated-DNA-protein-cysteine methyltransferase-like protein
VTFEDRVVAVVSSLRPGEVITYGEVAEEAGSPGAARAVGNILSKGGGDLPWWRVVAAGGRLSTGKEDRQAERLRAEGVVVTGNRVRPSRVPST